MVTTWKKRGSMSLMTLASTVPLPDDPQPSKMTITGTFASLMRIWLAASFTCSSSVRCLISALSGLLARANPLSMIASLGTLRKPCLSGWL